MTEYSMYLSNKVKLKIILVEFCEDQIFITSPSGAQTNLWRFGVNL